MDKLERIKELVELLNKAGKSYYSEGQEIMSNYEYDALYDELKKLEEETGCVLSNSPTVNVGYEVLSELPKERHDSPMLSLDKTKDREALRDWLGEQKGVLSWKLDGLTIVLTYEDGKLSKAVTRGNGEIGEIITNNARVFKNVPVTIPYKGKLVLRGEAIITYSDFNRINEEIPEMDAKYKNPRNLCSGSVRQLNNKITKERNVNFFAFALVSADNVDFKNSRAYQFEWLKKQGFEVVEYKMVDRDNIIDTIAWFEKTIVNNDFPSDGLVIIYDDIAYGESLGRTAKFPRNAMAFKWTDETADTVLRQIEWSASRTGLINPVAIFDPVELEGTKVSRASVHNISIMEGLKLGIGDNIRVFKANMIIPQIAANLTESGNISVPEVCPVCGQPTRISEVNDVKTLYCDNPECQAKHVKSFALLVSRDALNIDGLSEATLEKFIQKGFIKDKTDIFHLDKFKDEIVAMEGFGEKSYANLIEAVEKAKDTDLVRVLYGLGIDNIGLSTAKLIVKKLKGDPQAVLSVTAQELTDINGIGEVIAEAFVRYFADEKKKEEYIRLLGEVRLKEIEESQETEELAGKTFVITGNVTHFANRKELKELIERMGGKVTGSVTGNTSYLINNDSMSQSTKNKTAAKLGVPVITEEEFITLAGLEDML
uniref:NAD-dependent DNA ligase LigA n=1 Tax=Lachnospira sp. TaxID=2049031 RepID=UPI0040277241